MNDEVFLTEKDEHLKHILDLVEELQKLDMERYLYLVRAIPKKRWFNDDIFVYNLIKKDANDNSDENFIKLFEENVEYSVILSFL